MSEDIKGKIKKIVADHLGIEEEKVTEEASFIDDLGADSLDTVELVMAFEEEFGSEISDSEAEKILTVGDAIKFIESKAKLNYSKHMTHDVKNIMIILSSPSGVGKTTLTKKLQQKNQSFKISVSHTTRKPRSNEVDGVDYYFISKSKFEDLIKKKFYEYAKIFDNYYGTLKKNVDEMIVNNDIIFDIDWQGTKQLSKFENLNLLKIYLVTDNKEELKKRLIKRNQNTEEEIEKRFKAFDEDILHWNDYDYIIVNKNLEVCFHQIEKIIQERKSRTFI